MQFFQGKETSKIVDEKCLVEEKFTVDTLWMKSFPRLNVSSPSKKENFSPNEYPDLQCTDLPW